MKKVLITFLLFIAVFSFSSCKSEEKTLDDIFSANITIKSDNETYEALVDKSSAEDLTITMTSPEKVKGISYIYSADGMTVAFDELKCITDSGHIPTDSFQNILYQALCSLSSAQFVNEENDTDHYQILTDNGTVTIIAQKGKINELKNEKYQYDYYFTYEEKES